MEVGIRNRHTGKCLAQLVLADLSAMLCVVCVFIDTLAGTKVVIFNVIMSE